MKHVTRKHYTFTSKAAKLEELISDQLVEYTGKQVTKIQIGILRVIHDKEPLSVTELSDILYMNYGNTSSQCKKLEAEGYIIRKRNRKDERYIQLHLTPEGRNIYNTTSEWLTKFSHQVSQNFTETEWLEMETHIRNIENLINQSISILEKDKEETVVGKSK